MPERGGERGGRIRPGLLDWLLIGSVVLYAAVLILGPLIGFLWGAFSHGLVTFIDGIFSAEALHALKLTLLLSIAATAINTVFGVCAAWVLARDDFPGRRLLNGLIDLPLAISPVIAGFMVILLFGRGGWFEPALEALGIKVVFALPGMLIVTTFISLPFVTRELMPILVHRGMQQELAAYTLGASPWQTFWRVTLPGIRSGLLYGISLTFARAIGEFGAVLVVSGSVSGLTETSTLYIFRALDERQQAHAYVMALTLAFLSFALLTGMKRMRR